MKIARLVRDYLHQAGFAVLEATDGPTALSLAKAERPDMIVLDLGLPGMDGLDVTRQLRSSSAVPIIMLTARNEETDRIVGLGRRIVERAIEHADGDVKLHVEYDNPARRLYERIGFSSKYAEMRYSA